MTDYHSYNTPKKGSTDWHLPLNENFEKIDADIEIRDKQDNLDQYSPKANAKFLATDTGRIYLSTDGSDWVKWGRVSEEGADVIVADTASDIQPAIDELSERIVNGTTQGDIHSGVVKLRSKDYHPKTTIWLKRGVILEGSTASPFQKTTRGGTDATHQQRTTIYTDQMPEGPGALYPTDGTNTWTHFDTVEDHRAFDNGEITSDSELKDVTHPHLAVISAFDQIPVNSDTDRTDYQKRHVGYGTGLRNLNLDARAKQRWWDPSNESGSAKREATYFGVYDAIIMERVHGILVENVNTLGFLGYNGFYQDTNNIISRGNHYGGFGTGGTASDHHGATLQLDYSFRDYVKGAWSVDVTGPAPAVRLSGHVREKFVDGAWRQKPTIIGTDPVYLGSESDFEDGNAPLVEPHENDYVVLHEDQQTTMDGYKIENRSSRTLNGVLVDDNKFSFNNGRINVDGTAVVGASESGMEITNSVLNGSLGLQTQNHQGTLHAVRFQSDDAIEINNSNFNGGYYNCRFTGNRAIVGSQNNITMVLWNPNLTALSGETVTDSTYWRDNDSEKLVLVDPVGYINENAGKETQSGDGDTSSFTISHGMDETPEIVDITPLTEQAAGDIWLSNKNDTDFTINYRTAPTSGTDNLQWVWHACGWSHPVVNRV